MSTQTSLTVYFVIFFVLASIAFTMIIRAKMEQEDHQEKGLFRYQTILSPGGFFILLLVGSFLPVFQNVISPMIEGEMNLSPMYVLYRFSMSVYPILSCAAGYYLWLSLLEVFLRKRLRPSTMITLWAVPVFYEVFMIARWDGIWRYQRKNLVNLNSLSGKTISILFLIWFAGFLAITVWNLSRHFSFRKKLLRNARPLPANTAALWNAERERFQISTGLVRKVMIKEPLISSETNTPLAIGMFYSTIRIVLPDKDFSEDELGLIFRHELVHISRQDTQMKYFLMTMKALLWLVPWMWFITESCAGDIELSCDEAVLASSDDEEKKRYAKLLLHTAADARGISTCMSARAESLKYRMDRVLSGEKKSRGLILIAAAIFLLLISFGRVTMAVPEGTLKEVMERDNIHIDSSMLLSADSFDGNSFSSFDADDHFLQELFDTTVFRMDGSGNALVYTGRAPALNLYFRNNTGDMDVTIHISDCYLDISAYGTRNLSDTYYLPESD